MCDGKIWDARRGASVCMCETGDREQGRKNGTPNRLVYRIKNDTDDVCFNQIADENCEIVIKISCQ